MGGSSSGGGGGGNSGGGGGGGGNRRSTPKKAAPKKSNGTSRYFKKTSTPKKKVSTNGGRAGNGGVGSAAAKVSARVKATPKAARPATPTVSTAKTTPNTDNKITKSPIPKAAAKPAASINYNTDDASLTTKSKQSSVSVTAVKPKDKATPKGGKGHLNSIKGLDDAESHKTLLGAYQGYDKPRDNFNADTYKAKAEEGRNSEAYGVGDIIKDKYRNDEVSYNQAYWKGKKEGGATQAEMAAEQKALGSKKIYSGDRAITKNDQRKSKYILDSLTKSGIKPTVTEEKKGLLDETLLSTSSYDIGTGKPIVVGSEKTSPTLGGKRFGDDVTKTYVDGVATWTEKGVGDNSSITTSKTGAQNDRVEAGQDPTTDPTKEINDIDTQIKTETDPVKLRDLYKRRLMLMRMKNTNTKFAGLLGEADTTRTNLMSIG